MAKPAPNVTLAQQVTAYGIGKMNRQILFCAGPDCVDTATGEVAWNYLKKRVAELKLDQAPVNAFRNRCTCLRVCMSGPILAIQPDGVWYHSASSAVIERILMEHVLGGVPVAEYVFANQPLAPISYSDAPASLENVRLYAM